MKIQKLLATLLVITLFSFTSHQTRPFAAMSLTEMNLLYIGIDNPISFETSGIPNEDLRVSVTGGCTIHKASTYHYYLKVQSGTREVTLTLAQATEGGNKVVAKEKFRVRRLPDPKAQLGGLYNDGLPKAKAAVEAQTVLLATMGPGFSYNLKYRITSYQCTIITEDERTEYRGEGGALTPEIKEKISTLKANDLLIFKGIKAREVKYDLTAKLSPIVVEIR